MNDAKRDEADSRRLQWCYLSPAINLSLLLGNNGGLILLSLTLYLDLVRSTYPVFSIARLCFSSNHHQADLHVNLASTASDSRTGCNQAILSERHHPGLGDSIAGYNFKTLSSATHHSRRFPLQSDPFIFRHFKQKLPEATPRML